MADAPAGDATLILRRIRGGDRQATDELLPLVYGELRRLAGARMAAERPGATLSPTDLVHEVYLRLLGGEGEGWETRGHFFAAAAEAMRRILIERVRSARRLKRGGDLQRVEMVDDLAAVGPRGEEILAVDSALARLESVDPHMARVVKLRYFAGLSMEEIAGSLGISERTVRRQWTAARTWLYREVSGAPQ